MKGEELFLAINGFTLVNLIIFSSILAFRPNNSKTNYLLALVMIDPGLNFLNNIIILSGYIFKAPFFLFLFQGTAAVYGILVYAYVNSMIGKKFKWLSTLNILTLAIILLDIWYYIEFRLMPEEAQNRYLTCLTFKDCYPSQMNVINALCVTIWMAYFVKSYIVLKKYTFAAQNFFSDVERIKLKYLKTFVILVILLNLALAILYSAIPTSYVEYVVIPLIVNTVNLFLLYYAFSQNAVFNKIEYCTLVENNQTMERFESYQEPLCKEIKELMDSKNQAKYKLTQAEIEDIAQKITNYVNTQKPYLDKRINLTKFSSDIEACSHTVSLALNTYFKMNFFDFINHHRVEEAKRLLSRLDEHNLKVEAIGYECGFNSKTAFYRAFKKFTGLSPIDFYQREAKKLN